MSADALLTSRSTPTARPRRPGSRWPGSRWPDDLRAAALGVVAWCAALTALLGPGWLLLALLAAASATAGWAARRGRLRPEHLAWLLVALVVAAATLLRLGAVRGSPVHDLAADGASVETTVRLTSDPVTKQGRFADFVVVRATVTEIEGRGQRWHRLSAPTLVIAPVAWRRLHLGERVHTPGRLATADGRDLSAVLLARGSPEVTDRPGWPYRAAERVRAGVRESASPGASVGAGAPRVLVPALVDGDDSGLDPQVAADFKTAGLTHLLAVSGTNLTLVVGALLLLARWAGVRATALAVVGGLGVLGFVLLARPEPSVLRAAAMGSVALLGLGSNGRERGVRALGLAVLSLMLLDPWLATEAGFALSAMATAGILLLAPGWRDRLQRWLPRWAAEAIAVPTAAQLACTPVVAAISGQVSLVAVPANLLAAPVVGPATVLGLVGGLLSTLWAPLGHPCGLLACWCAQWLVSVARHAAALPSAAIGWPVNPLSLAVLVLVCGWLAAHLGTLFARARAAVACCAVALVTLLVPLPTPGWPPHDWVLLACDIGQGDGLLLHVGPHAAVVVDTGPDPTLIDACLRRMGIREVPLVVLTHFHADHVDGLPGVLHGRRVGGIEVTSLDDPAGGVALVRRAASVAGVPLRVVRAGERVRIGPLAWRVLAPTGPPPADSDSPPNDASIVMLVEVAGVWILMMGDEETGSQERLATVLPAVLGEHRVDVLKVAHHGSSKQDDDLVLGLHPRLAVISDGVDNDYGHPAPSTLSLLHRAGALVRRTDLDGDVAVTVDGAGHLGVTHRMPAVRPRPGA